MVSFLELPSTIRHRIYCDAGLVIDGKVYVRSPSESKIRDPDEPWCWKKADVDFSLGLFLTCRAINAEASLLFFSKNQFIVCATSTKPWCVGALEPLQSLVRPCHGQLRYLVVDLNASKSPFLDGWRCGHGDDPGPLVSLSSSILTEWIDTVEAIGPLIKPQSLELSFTCDVADMEASEAIAASLKYFPTLLTCDLRLFKKPDSQIQGTVEQAAILAVRQAPSSSSTFRFMDLPVELRLQILEYTDLVTPLKEVEWNPKDGYYVRYRTGSCTRRYEHFVLFENNEAISTAKLETCPPTTEWWPKDSAPRDSDLNHYHHSCQFCNCWQNPAETGCFCLRYHAAYSTPSPRRRCACWMPPRPLFLVNRQLYQHAQSVFFHHNRIIVTPAEGLFHITVGPRPELGIYSGSVFLRSALPPSSLRYLRFLDIIFPPVNKPPKAEDPAYLDWKQTLEWARDKLDLPRLTLRVEITDYFGSSNIPECRLWPSRNGFRMICAGYFVIIRPLKTWGSSSSLTMSGGDGEGGDKEAANRDGGEGRGLYRFFAHLTNPFFEVHSR